jgi:1-acyl-sn-glycerol-3-phosphate acyltransferase
MRRIFYFARSVVHLLWMGVTVVPYSLLIVILGALGVSKSALYPWARRWLKSVVDSARWFCGVRYEVHGLERVLALGDVPVILLMKHQSAYETFLMPAVMPKPLAYVFKKELLSIPFFGWSIGRLDMIHIDRADRVRAFAKVVQQGRELLARGVWVIMFPEGTRTPRGQVGAYKQGGARLAVQTGAYVVPVAVSSGRCWPRRAFVKIPGLVEVSMGPPISSVGRNSQELMAEVQDWIEREMQQLDPEAYATDDGLRSAQ